MSLIFWHLKLPLFENSYFNNPTAEIYCAYTVIVTNRMDLVSPQLQWDVGWVNGTTDNWGLLFWRGKCSYCTKSPCLFFLQQIYILVILIGGHTHTKTQAPKVACAHTDSGSLKPFKYVFFWVLWDTTRVYILQKMTWFCQSVPVSPLILSPRVSCPNARQSSRLAALCRYLPPPPQTEQPLVWLLKHLLIPCRGFSTVGLAPEPCCSPAP